MELIAAVYENWGIGRDNTQPVTLAADRKFFREMTRGKMVIVGRRTIADFPGGRPLPGRVNVALSRRETEIPGFTLAASPEAALALAQQAGGAVVIGGGSVYRAMLPYCDTAYITKLHISPECDTFLPNLDADPSWRITETLKSGIENGIPYEMLMYRRIS